MRGAVALRQQGGTRPGQHRLIFYGGYAIAAGRSDVSTAISLITRNANIVIIAAHNAPRNIGSSISTGRATAMHIAILLRLHDDETLNWLHSPIPDCSILWMQTGCSRLQYPTRIMGSYGRRMPGASRCHL